MKKPGLRDVSWLTLVLAMIAGWWLHWRQMTNEINDLHLQFFESACRVGHVHEELAEARESLLAHERDTRATADELQKP